MAAVCVFCASSDALDERYLDLARRTGTALAEAGHTLISGGGRVGMMGAVAQAARAAGGRTIGVIPESLIFQEVMDTASDEVVTTSDMAERKREMMARSDAFVVLPGGLGTLDELFEVWTTAALGLHHKPVLVLDPEGFYAGLLDWLAGLVDPGFVRSGVLERLAVVDSPEAVTAALHPA